MFLIISALVFDPKKLNAQLPHSAIRYSLFMFITFIGTKRGNFCYGLDGSIGTVDENINDVPVNVECDPRVTCSQSTNQELCFREFPNMRNIMVSRRSFFT